LRSLRELVASPRLPLIEGTCCKTPIETIGTVVASDSRRRSRLEKLGGSRRLIEQVASCGPRFIFQSAASAKPCAVKSVSAPYRTHMVHIIAYRVDHTPKRTFRGIQILPWG